MHGTTNIKFETML